MRDTGKSLERKGQNSGELIRKATSDDAVAVAALMDGHDMGFAADISAHTVLEDGGKICAVALALPVDTLAWHLPVIVANPAGHGYGRKLLAAILDGLPEGTLITTIAKGSAAGFYEKLGFVKCPWSAIDASFDWQCDECMDEEICRPVSMIYGF